MNTKYVGLIPIAIVLVGLFFVTLIFYPEQNLPRSLVFELPSPFSSAHSFFLSISALVIAYFFARGFLSNSSFNLIALGNASLVLGFGFLLSQILGNAPFGGPNQLTGISSMVFLFSGVFYASFATLSLSGKSIRTGKPVITLIVAYAASILLVVAVIEVVEARLIPDFFVKGAGPTALREQVLGTAVVLFSYSSVVLIMNFARSNDTIIYWFSLGLASIAVGFLSAFLGKVPGGPFSWLGRFTVSVGGIYFIVAIVAAYRNSNTPRG